VYVCSLCRLITSGATTKRKRGVSIYGPEADFYVLAETAEEAIEKVKKENIGTKADPDENGVVIEVTGIIIRKVELRCDIDIC
jgi:hypothetical protein